MYRHKSRSMSVRIGYACICLELREKDPEITSTHTITLAKIEKNGLNAAKELALKNIQDLEKILQHNEKNGIRFFRITSNLFPHMENPRLLGLSNKDTHGIYDLEFAKKELAKVGKYAREHGHRLTMHPGQYAQLGSKNPDVITQTIKDLNLHADILLAMGMTPTLGSVIIIHGGGTFGDKPAAITRWKENFRRLPATTAQFIALENDEFQYSVLDLLPLCEELHIPLCIDFFHHDVSQRIAIRDGTISIFNVYDHGILSRVMNTWKLRGIKPKCHYSEQRPNSRPGAHSDCVSEIPRSLINFAHAESVDIMLEVKHKDICALQIYDKYFTKIVHQGRVEWYLKTNF